MTVAHVLQVSEMETDAPLDFQLSALRLSYTERERADLARCRTLHTLWQRWQRERNTSQRDFLRSAIPDFEEKEGTAYRHLYSGAALTAGFTGARLSHLEPLGWALMIGGKTVADVQALIDQHGADEARSLLRKERSHKSSEATTTRRLPESSALTLDTLTQRLSEHPDAPVEDTERRGLLMRMLDAAPPPVFAALAQMASTGENTTEALTRVLAAYQPDFYEELKRGGCLVPTCSTHTGIELHHVARTADSTKRGGDLMIPLCSYCHNQDGKHDHAHSMKRGAWFDLWGGEAQFLWAVWERYAQAAQAVRGKQA